MKKIASMFLLAATLVGSLAFAAPQQGVVEFKEDGTPVMTPLHGWRCQTPDVPQPTASNPRYCDYGGGRKCPPGYDPVAKYCWGGWGMGWHRCGYTCQDNGMYSGGN